MLSLPSCHGRRPEPERAAAAPRRDGPGEFEEFVLGDPDCVHTCFDREPSTADVDHILCSAPDGTTVDRRHLTEAFTATGALVGVLHCLTGWPGEASYYTVCSRRVPTTADGEWPGRCRAVPRTVPRRPSGQSAVRERMPR